SNNQLFNDFIDADSEENHNTSTAYYGSYLLMILYRLKLLLFKNNSMCDTLINIRCYIDSEAYRGKANYHRSADGRSEGIISISNSISDCITLDRDTSDDTNKIMIFSNKNCLINLSALMALLGAISPSYGGEVSKTLNRKLSKKKHNGFSTNRGSGVPSTPEHLIESKIYCVTKLPIIDDVSFYDHDIDKDPIKIGWFEKYSSLEHARYDKEAYIALKEFKSMLPIGNNTEYTSIRR
ncbi:MAG: hypothetical protein KAH32_06145, partial [Chlamydiia bacterium]|nr:hypothetical protein [Chlamydiia bacterium]